MKRVTFIDNELRVELDGGSIVFGKIKEVEGMSRVDGLYTSNNGGAEALMVGLITVVQKVVDSAELPQRVSRAVLGGPLGTETFYEFHSDGYWRIHASISLVWGDAPSSMVMGFW